jgi:hypothetical protein
MNRVFNFNLAYTHIQHISEIGAPAFLHENINVAVPEEEVEILYDKRRNRLQFH